MDTKLHFSSARADWSTPQWLVDALPYNITWDACATKESSKCGDRYFGPDRKMEMCRDALALAWPNMGGQYYWMNPPYGREIFTWMKKAYTESPTNTNIVCLVPARTDTKWWHEFAMKAWRIHLCKGRIKFDGQKYAAPFPSALVVFNAYEAYEKIGGPLFSALDLNDLRDKHKRSGALRKSSC